MEKNIEKHCAVCGHTYLSDIYGQGRCPYCDWFNNPLGEDFSNKVIFPNVVSLNKAKQLIKGEKKFKPSIDDFGKMFNFYGEVEFTYNGRIYDLSRADNDGEIEYGCASNFIFYFNNTKEFVEKAKTIEGFLVRDIWDKVENPKYM